MGRLISKESKLVTHGGYPQEMEIKVETLDLSDDNAGGEHPSAAVGIEVEIVERVGVNEQVEREQERRGVFVFAKLVQIVVDRERYEQKRKPVKHY